jgi:hypothetical protein
MVSVNQAGGQNPSQLRAVFQGLDAFGIQLSLPVPVPYLGYQVLWADFIGLQGPEPLRNDCQ